MKEVSGYNPSKDPRLINCKTGCGNERCFAKRYGLFAEKTCPNFKEPMPLTNYDRIRAKSVEEMAEFIANAVDCCNCKHPRNGCSENDETCAACWLDWLKEEAVSDG